MNLLLKYLQRTAMAAALLYSAVSCTYDYFEDENNFWIYVPQIKENSIEDFYVAFHDANGRHMRTSHIHIPFDQNDRMRDGILRFKLKPGESAISCCAQTQELTLTEGKLFSESFVSAPAVPREENTYAPCGPLRIVKDQKLVYPIGHPNAKIPQTIDITEECVYMGTIIHEFKNLPTAITRIDITYTGLATRFGFNGSFFDNFTTTDRTKVSYTINQRQDESVVCRDMYFPSAGMGLEGADENPVPLRLDVLFYVGETVAGHFSEDISDPEDENGATITGDVFLRPKHTLKFTYKGFTVTGISLVGWGDIGSGEVTPM